MPGSSGARTFTRENSSQLRSAAMATGLERGVSSMSRLIWRRLAAVMGISCATRSMAPSTSLSLTSSRLMRMRKAGRLEAISTPSRSRMRPRGGGFSLKLNWLDADSS